MVCSGGDDFAESLQLLRRNANTQAARLRLVRALGGMVHHPSVDLVLDDKERAAIQSLLVELRIQSDISAKDFWSYCQQGESDLKIVRGKNGKLVFARRCSDGAKVTLRAAESAIPNVVRTIMEDQG